MSKVGTVGKKAAKTTGKKAPKAVVKHEARGVVAKVERRPVRSVTLLAIGGSIGALTGWIAGRKTARPPEVGSGPA
jgi:hypothetical protein